MGSWLLVVALPDRTPARVPVAVRREQAAEAEVTLFLPGEIPENFVPIAAGACPLQGDFGHPYGEPEESRFLDDAALARFPVTCRDYADFLSALSIEEAVRRAPRESDRAATWWPRVGGRFVVPTPAWLAAAPPEEARAAARPIYAGVDWREDWPVFGITWHDAAAYARWAAAREGRLLCLPHDALWEKGARGPDRRYFPWGNTGDASLANVNVSQPERMQPDGVGSFPGDESPYGVRGMGGNIQQWCLNSTWRGGRRWTILRGASWPQGVGNMRSSIRTVATKEYLNFTVGMRLAAVLRTES